MPPVFLLLQSLRGICSFAQNESLSAIHKEKNKSSSQTGNTEIFITWAGQGQMRLGVITHMQSARCTD